MSADLSQLLRLSQLRADHAEAHLRAMQHALQMAEAAVAQARRSAEQVSYQIEQQRHRAREAFVGAVHARGAVENMLLDLGSFDAAEAVAEQRIVDAIAQRDAAIPPVLEAREAVLAARASVTKRAFLVDQAGRKALLQAELRSDAEAEEQWISGRFLGGSHVRPA